MEVGPVEVDAARCWLGHVLHGMAVVRTRHDLLPFRLPPEVADDIDALLTMWWEVAQAAGDDVFHWEGVLDDDRVLTLLRYWANLDSMSDDLLRDLGIDWTPPAGRPFFAALTSAVADAVASADLAPDPFADLLVERADEPVRSVRSA